jgi:hypothetical protein
VRKEAHAAACMLSIPTRLARCLQSGNHLIRQGAARARVQLRQARRDERPGGRVQRIVGHVVRPQPQPQRAPLVQHPREAARGARLAVTDACKAGAVPKSKAAVAGG